MSPRPGIDRLQLLQTARTGGSGWISCRNLGRACRQAGRSVAFLYNHVDGLPGLHAALMLYGLQTLQDRSLKAVAGRSGEDARVMHALPMSTLPDLTLDYTRPHCASPSGTTGGTASMQSDCRASSPNLGSLPAQ